MSRVITAILLFIFLVFFVWFFQPLGLWAATDDAALKVFTLTPDKMLGTARDSGYSGSANFPTMKNLVAQDFGLVNFSNGSPIIVFEAARYVTDIVEAPDTFYQYNRAYSSYPFWCNNSSTMEAMTDFPYVSASLGDLFVTNALVSGTNRTLLVCSAGIAVHDYTTKLSVSYSNPYNGYTPTNFETWKNRLFAAGDNFILYSKASDYTNFNVGSFQGGIILIYPYCKIRKMVAHNEGLYIFTTSGIYFLSGALPETWRLEKVSDIVVGTSATTAADWPVRSFNGKAVFFVDVFGSLYSISNGYTITKISECPDSNMFAKIGYSKLSIFNDRYIVLTKIRALTDTTLSSSVYDLVKKCWYNWSGIVDSSKNYYVMTYPYGMDGSSHYYYVYEKNINSMFTGTSTRSEIGCYSNSKKYDCFQIYFETPHFSLDGNEAAFKKIKRIEVDCIPQKYMYYGATYYYESAGFNSYTNNRLIFNFITDKQTAGVTREVSLPQHSPTVSLYNPAETYTFRFSDLNEFKAIKMKFETAGAVIIRQVRFYYETVGIKQ